MKKEEYRIVEQHNKFYVQKLVKFLWFVFYVDVCEDDDNDDCKLKEFKTLDDARKYVEGDKVKYHKV